MDDRKPRSNFDNNLFRAVEKFGTFMDGLRLSMNGPGQPLTAWILNDLGQREDPSMA